jgi:hypothetical protein
MTSTLARYAALSAGLFLLLTTTGCATIVTGRGPDQTVRINSIPRGADVYLNGNHIGVTPTTATLSRQDDQHVRIELQGYQTYERYLETRFNPWILGNIPIFFPIGTIIGVIIDMQSDSDRWLRPDRISVNLVPEGSTGRPATHQPPPTQRDDPALIEVEPVPHPDRGPPQQ